MCYLGRSISVRHRYMLFCCTFPTSEALHAVVTAFSHFFRLSGLNSKRCFEIGIGTDWCVSTEHRWPTHTFCEDCEGEYRLSRCTSSALLIIGIGRLRWATNDKALIGLFQGHATESDNYKQANSNISAIQFGFVTRVYEECMQAGYMVAYQFSVLSYNIRKWICITGASIQHSYEHV